MQIQDKIMLLRRQKGMSQEELAAKLGVSRQAVYKWESGINTPDLDKIKKIASFFNVTYDVLLDDDIELGHSEELAATDSSSREKSKKAEFKYRDVFVSENEYDRDQSDFDRGYMSTKQNSTLISEVFLQCRRDETEQHLAELGYDEFYPFDTGAYSYFVVNHKQNLVGFYFDEGEQFVCPFENLVKFSYTYDSDVFLTDHHSHVTVVGGEVGAVGVTRTTS